MKRCSKCTEEKDESCFYVKRGKLDSWCKSCGAQLNKTWKAKTVQARAEYQHDYHQQNREKILARTKDRYHQHIDLVREQQRKWRLDNPTYGSEAYQSNKVQRLEYSKEWKRSNSHRIAASTRKRRVIIARATPIWADSEWEQFFLKEIYHLAKLRTICTGVNHEVDHCIPLLNKNVCGLHCAANLRVLTEQDNIRKGNNLLE